MPLAPRDVSRETCNWVLTQTVRALFGSWHYLLDAPLRIPQGGDRVTLGSVVGIGASPRWHPRMQRRNQANRAFTGGEVRSAGQVVIRNTCLLRIGVKGDGCLAG